MCSGHLVSVAVYVIEVKKAVVLKRLGECYVGVLVLPDWLYQF